MDIGTRRVLSSMRNNVCFLSVYLLMAKSDRGLISTRKLGENDL